MAELEGGGGRHGSDMIEKNEWRETSEMLERRRDEDVEEAEA